MQRYAGVKHNVALSQQNDRAAAGTNTDFTADVLRNFQDKSPANSPFATSRSAEISLLDSPFSKIGTVPASNLDLHKTPFVVGERQQGAAIPGCFLFNRTFVFSRSLGNLDSQERSGESGQALEAYLMSTQ